MNIVYDTNGVAVPEQTCINNGLQIGTVSHRGMIFKDGHLSYLPLPEGYYDGDSYYAVIKDYLGSTRVVLKNNASVYDMAAEVPEVNHYDPWGVEFGMSAEPFGVQDYKHQGKERMSIFDMNMHDHGTRLAFNALGKWTAMDPLTEKYYSVSLYAFCNNNPVINIDPDGRWVLVFFVKGTLGAGVGYAGTISGQAGRARDKHGVSYFVASRVNHLTNQNIEPESKRPQFYAGREEGRNET